MKVDSISFLIKEIKNCMDKGECVAAFYMALTLPDICGKLEYPSEKPSKRYILWFDEYIGNYEQSPFAKEDPSWADMPYMSGENMYKIRCSLLHAGTNDLGEEFNLDDFLFQWNGAVERSGVDYDFNGNKRKYWYVNVRLLTQKIMWATEAFIRKGTYNRDDLPKINEYGIEDIPDVFKVK